MSILRWNFGLTGVGQVMFQESALSGALFLAGVVSTAGIFGFWALGGSLCGILTANVKEPTSHRPRNEYVHL